MFLRVFGNTLKWKNILGSVSLCPKVILYICTKQINFLRNSSLSWYSFSYTQMAGVARLCIDSILLPLQVNSLGYIFIASATRHNILFTTLYCRYSSKNGISPLGHCYQRDTSIQWTQNSFPEKWDTSIEQTSLFTGKDETRALPLLWGHLSTYKMRLTTKALII